MFNPTLISWIDELLRAFDEQKSKFKPATGSDNADQKTASAATTPEMPNHWYSDAEAIITEIRPEQGRDKLPRNPSEVAMMLNRHRRLLMHRNATDLIPGMVNNAITSSPWFKLQVAILALVFTFGAVGAVVVGNSVIDVQAKSKAAADDIEKRMDQIDREANSFVTEVRSKGDELETAIAKATAMAIELETVKSDLSKAIARQEALKTEIENRRNEIDRLQADVEVRVKDDSTFKSEIAQIVATAHRNSLRGDAGKPGLNGEDGADGKAPSAIEVAVALVKEHRATLRGDRGNDGKSITASEVAKVLVERYHIDLRGPAGKDGRDPSAADVATILSRDYREKLRGMPGEDGTSPSAEEVADLLVGKYRLQLRGPPGKDGASPAVRQVAEYLLAHNGDELKGERGPSGDAPTAAEVAAVLARDHPDFVTPVDGS